MPSQYLWSPAGGGEPVLISRADVEELHRVAQLLDKHLPGWVHEYSTPLPGAKTAGGGVHEH